MSSTTAVAAWQARFAAGERYFKFIGGANLRETAVVERLATLVALSGGAIFDVAAEPTVVKTALRGFARARAWITEAPDWLLTVYGGQPLPALDPVVMVSITLSGDRHTEIAMVEDPLCIQCDRCTPVCPPGAIINGVVQDSICTGCGLCVPECPTDCIVIAPRKTDPDVEACWQAGARALEIHTGAADAMEVAAARPMGDRWMARGGLLAYSLDGAQLGRSRVLELATLLGEPGLILQADGNPISGTSGLDSTVPAVRLAQAIAALETGAWLQPSGGANDLTGPLAQHWGVPITGVGMGSFARRGAKSLEAGDDTPEAWATAVMETRRLVLSVLSPEPLSAPLAHHA